MKLGRVIEAWRALERLADTPMGYQSAHEVARVRRALRPDVAYYEGEMAKLVAQYGVRDEKGNLVTDDKGGNTIDWRQADKFLQKARELESVEVEGVPGAAIVRPPREITARDVEALDGFLTFCEEDE